MTKLLENIYRCVNIHLLGREPSEKARGAEKEDPDQDREGDRVLVGRPARPVDKGLHHAQEGPGAECGAGDVAYSAEDGGDEGL